MNLEKIMQGHFVTLRPPVESDSATYFKWINDKDLVLLNGEYKDVSEEDHRQWFSNLSGQKNTLTLSIVENQDNRLIGSCSLRHINTIHHHAELQIRIGERAFQNKGYGTEAVKQLVQLGFHDFNLKRIYLHVFCTNERAINAYKKCHFQIEGVLRQAAFINNNYIDLILMAIIKD